MFLLFWNTTLARALHQCMHTRSKARVKWPSTRYLPSLERSILPASDPLLHLLSSGVTRVLSLVLATCMSPSLSLSLFHRVRFFFCLLKRSLHTVFFLSECMEALLLDRFLHGLMYWEWSTTSSQPRLGLFELVPRPNRKIHSRFLHSPLVHRAKFVGESNQSHFTCMVWSISNRMAKWLSKPKFG